MRRGSALTTLGLVYFMTLFEVLTMCALYTGAGARFRTRYSLSAGDILDIINKLVLLQLYTSILMVKVVVA